MKNVLLLFCILSVMSCKKEEQSEQLTSSSNPIIKTNTVTPIQYGGKLIFRTVWAYHDSCVITHKLILHSNGIDTINANAGAAKDGPIYFTRFWQSGYGITTHNDTFDLKSQNYPPGVYYFSNMVKTRSCPATINSKGETPYNCGWVYIPADTTIIVTDSLHGYNPDDF